LTKTLKERRGGKLSTVTKPLFPGYLFLEAEAVDQDTYWYLKKQTAVFHFLMDGESFNKLSSKDVELLKHFLGYGENIGPSTVEFDINNRIQVVSGPMMGLEGKITRVDRRKKRAKILIELEGRSFNIDLPYEILQASEPSQKNSQKECQQ
jgi:transcriptional antiterminator NusG